MKNFAQLVHTLIFFSGWIWYTYAFLKIFFGSKFVYVIFLILNISFLKSLKEKSRNCHSWCDSLKNTIRKLCKILQKSSLRMCWWWLFVVNNVWSRCFTYMFCMQFHLHLTCNIKKKTHRSAIHFHTVNIH